MPAWLYSNTSYFFGMMIIYIHIGVGFNVAYPYAGGNAKAWKRGISDRRIPRFFVYAGL